MIYCPQQLSENECNDLLEISVGSIDTYQFLANIQMTSTDRNTSISFFARYTSKNYLREELSFKIRCAI